MKAELESRSLRFVPLARRGAAVALGLLSLVAPGLAQSEPTNAELQQQIDELAARLDKTATTGSADISMKVFGRIQLDAWAFPSSDAAINVFETGDPTEPPPNNVEFRRARIGVQGGMYENMLYKFELDFGHTDGLTFKDNYFGFEDLPVVQTLLIGNQKRPYSLDQLNSSNHNVFMERPFIGEGVNDPNRRVGVAAYGHDQDEDWSWRYGFYLMDPVEADGQIQSGDLQPEVAGRLARTMWYGDDGRDYGHLAVSGAFAWPDDTTSASRFRSRPEARSQSRWIDTGMIAGLDSYGLAGLEAVANMGRTQLTAEVQGTNAQRGSGFEDVSFWGGYVYAAYFLTGEYMPWRRDRGVLGRVKPKRNVGDGGWGAWQVAARYSYADFTDQDIYGGVGSALTLGLNWYWTPHASVQLNYIDGSIDDRQVDVGGTTYTGGDYRILGIRFRVDF
jgi:phosphate-selective porin OprO/OprP